MSNERDELAAVVNCADWTSRSQTIADAVLSAGYRKPQQVTTAEELAGLPDLSVVRTSAGTIANLVGDAAYFFGYDASAPRSVLALPATVLHVGGAK